MKLIYPAIFTPCEEKAGFTVVVPDLPGCVTEGDSLIHAIDMGTDAACGWVLGELEDGNSIRPLLHTIRLRLIPKALSICLFLTWMPIRKNMERKLSARILRFLHG